MNEKHIIIIDRCSTKTKRYVVSFPNGSVQRFSYKSQALKFAEDSNDNNLEIIDKTPRLEKVKKLNRNWQ